MTDHLGSRVSDGPGQSQCREHSNFTFHQDHGTEGQESRGLRHVPQDKGSSWFRSPFPLATVTPVPPSFGTHHLSSDEMQETTSTDVTVGEK